MSIRESGHHTCYAQLYLHPCKIRIPGKFSCTTAPTPLHDRHYRKLRNCSARSRLSKRQYVAGVLCYTSITRSVWVEDTCGATIGRAAQVPFVPIAVPVAALVCSFLLSTYLCTPAVSMSALPCVALVCALISPRARQGKPIHGRCCVGARNRKRTRWRQFSPRLSNH